ncbi:MAG: hypothetical protein CME64_04680 [Halobacteriovoraceae bacterium]|nr:hypothetical protein [Halobacteriovoraceae bacterium]|tara:strand:+ start:226040 stop:229246 length:3207 start_codon:yes stop_codon:yes gene_type:complete
MKSLLLTILAILLSGCFEETIEDPGGLFAEHKSAEDSLTISLPSDATYVDTEELVFYVEHPFVLTVTGTPRLSLNIGGTTRYADYSAGSGTKRLQFVYTVQGTDNDADGISFGSNSIDLNGGTITFNDGTAAQNASLSFSPGDTSAIIVDNTGPVISSITPPLDNTYMVDASLTFFATFDEEVYVTGTPQMQVNINGSLVNVAYTGGSGTTRLTFRHTVLSTDLDMDGITITPPLLLNSGTIKDEAGNDATLTFALQNLPNVYLDGDMPYIVSAIDPVDKTYVPGDTIEVSYTFTEVVNVTGTPRVGIDIGGNVRYADFLSGSGSDTLVFSHSLVSGNEDDDGVDVADIIDLNGGTIQDAEGKNANIIFYLAKTPGAIVHAPLPTVTSIVIPSAPADGYFNLGEEIFFTLNFNDEVDTTGLPQLVMELTTLSPTLTYVDYNSGSGSSSLVMRYVVQTGDEDHDGLTLNSMLNLNGGTIQNANGTNANLDISTAIAAIDTSTLLVDALTPTVESITPPANATYAIGDALNFAFNFNETINVTGTPRVALDIGGATRYATYQSGSGSSNLTFRYTVQNSDLDTDGISITSNSVDLNGGSLIDLGGNAADLDISSVKPNLSSVLVDGIRPTVTGIAITASTYTETQVITATVTYDDTVNITGSPRIPATFETMAASPELVYQAGSGSSTVTFSYTVVDGDGDPNGIDLSAITLSGGTIQDINGNNANLTLSTTNFPSVLVDAIDPTATLTTPANGSYINASTDSTTFAIAGTCDDATATVDIKIDGVSAAGQAGVSCDGTNLSGTFNSTGLSEGAKSFTVDITDTVGNSSSSTANTVTKDTVAPTLDSVAAPANGNYALASNMDFTATFSESVTVTGTRLSLTVGSSTLYANYNSGSSTSNIVYRYTIGASDYDEDGVVLNSPLEYNGGSITDLAGNALSSNAFAAPNTSLINVNDGEPQFEWYDSTPALVGTYDYGDPNANTSETFTVRNIGTAPTKASFQINVNNNDGAVFVIATDNCTGNLIAINDTCAVTIDYNDIGAPGLKTGDATADDPGFTVNPGYTLNLEGTR